ncbi:hypothetical protein AB205_0003950 [Aquarana catesbeiana]|uniref:Uncharacterized protein n=1 Tax=Aquarana catesbeiana TaxID=8400 RepID=A0A2G9QE44_AQUCT|nr:hypothetical protein AB205_0003950 [Aquarana catesbeiana]
MDFCASELCTHNWNFRQVLWSENLRTCSQTFVGLNSDNKCSMEHTHCWTFRQQAHIQHLLSENPIVCTGH